jgi:hypothetical protein
MAVGGGPFCMAGLVDAQASPGAVAQSLAVSPRNFQMSRDPVQSPRRVMAIVTDWAYAGTTPFGARVAHRPRRPA